jgi:alpha-L-fucosidase 2
LRSANVLSGKGLSIAKNENPNPLFELNSILKPIISQEAKLNQVSLKKTYLYDLPTEAGKSYVLIGK